ncbi:MAG: serine hydrolase domain-containing protein [Oceanicaulis sp.]
MTILLAAALAVQPFNQPGDAAIEAAMEAAYTPGLALVYLDGCRPQPPRVFGVADVETGAPVEAGTRFEAASLSKPLFAWLFMEAVDAGLVDPDAPFAQTLESPRIRFRALYDRLTPRLALSHQTGLPNWAGNAGDPDRMNRLSFLFEPGTAMSYSGEGYELTQRYFEASTGAALDAAFRAAFSALMPGSAYSAPLPEGAPTAFGHNDEGRRNGGRPVTVHPHPNAAHSLVTTAPDYARFLARACTGDGLSAEAHGEMLRPQVELRGDEWPGEPLDFGEARLFWSMGWGVQELNGRRVHFHWGDNGQFKAFAAFDAQSGDGLVFLANGETALQLIGPLAEPVLGELDAAIAFSD